ncbi:MAG: retropepsin-like domain-containing protein [Ignavibacteriae bacterium]|nr:retropepsin-like domain-containing protein [Ignavibacteriota bacterium]
MKLKFELSRGLVIVPVTFVSTSEQGIAKLALDTGAAHTLVSSDIAVMLGYDPAVSKERKLIVTASGTEYASRIFVNSIQALGITRTNFPVLCHTLPNSARVDGLLGLDFFKNTLLTIDFKQGTITVQE